MHPNRMSKSDIRIAFKRVPNWSVQSEPNDALYLEWRGANFKQTFALMTRIADLAEEINHHPEWTNVYSHLTIRLTTHDVGGLSELDFLMAERIDAFIASLGETTVEMKRSVT